MRFWDSSAVIPLLVDEASSPSVRAVHADDIVMSAWWGTGVECVSALARLERNDQVDAATLTQSLDRLDQLSAGWLEVEPTRAVRRAAVRLLRVHPIRAADAFQLAAAIVAAEDRAGSLPFVTLDNRLAAAADREGFAIIQPG